MHRNSSGMGITLTAAVVTALIVAAALVISCLRMRREKLSPALRAEYEELGLRPGVLARTRWFISTMSTGVVASVAVDDSARKSGVASRAARMLIGIRRQCPPPGNEWDGVLACGEDSGTGSGCYGRTAFC